MAGDGGEDARRAAYERLYAEYREAVRAYHEARANGVKVPEWGRLWERMRELRAQLGAWRQGR